MSIYRLEESRQRSEVGGRIHEQKDYGGRVYISQP
jgi:hypothetical protein